MRTALLDGKGERMGRGRTRPATSGGWRKRGFPGSRGKTVHEPLRPVLMDLDSLPFPARHLRRGDECDMWKGATWPHKDQVHNSRGCWG